MSALLIKLLELLSPAVSEAWALVRAHQGPVTVALHPLHEQVWDPQGEEQVTGAHLLLACVLLEIEKIKHISMPRLEVDGECTRTLKNKH